MTLSRKNLVLRILLFIGAVAALVYFLPRSDRKHYIFEVNRPWTYPLLTAPFDIPIHLDSVSTARLRDSIDAEFQPVYKRDATLEKTVIAECTAKINALSDERLTPSEKNQVIKALRALYADGIVDRETFNQISVGSLPIVRFISDNVAISVPTSKMRSTFRAYEHLDSLLSDRGVRQALTAARISEMLTPNITADSLANARLLADAYQKATAPVGVLQQGERIIDKGDIVTPRLATVLETYEQMAAERSDKAITQHHYPVAGQTLYMIILMAALFAYLMLFRPAYYDDNRTLLFVVLLTVLFSLFAYAMNATFRVGLYIAPFTIVPILVLVFLDSRTALLVQMTVVLACAIVSNSPLEFIFIQFVAGLAAIDSLRDLSRRSQLIRTAAVIFLAYSLGHIAVEIIQTGTLDKTEGRIFGAFGINAILISFSYVLMFLIERVFGFTSQVTLVELSDINNPRLRELSEECPGTFNHSMAVSNLASEGARAIGANTQMVRTGALYHDIGKIKNPAFFTENQHGVNPHDALSPQQSARIIISHVTEGLSMAEKAKLPGAIRDFISQHHGRGTAKYFYTTYCNAHPDEKVDPAPFTYPGPNPQSRETSLLMMADAVEAASRSLKDYSPEAIRTLVDRIIDGQIADGLHNESPLSFKDVQTIKDSFARRLTTMYHSRIAYPDKK